VKTAKKRTLILELGNKEKYELAWRKCFLKLPHWKKKEIEQKERESVRIQNELAREVATLAESEGFVKNIINEI
jgi:hypothetical protein